MRNKKIPISVGVTAYNEEANIKNLLYSILRQKQNDFYIKDIIVISDGSSDRTVERIKEIKDRRIKVIVGKHRKGQNVRLNMLLKYYFTGDILVLLEADTVMRGEDFLIEIIKPFRTLKNVNLVHSHALPMPIQNGNLFERSLIFFDSLKKQSFRFLHNGTNVYLYGSGKAISRSLASKLKWPKDVPEDSYGYFFCKHHKLKIVHQPNAVVYYRSPMNPKDYFKKTSRFNKGRKQLLRYFRHNFVEKEYKIPKGWILKLLLKGFISSPLLIITYLWIHLLSKLYLIFTPKFNPLWDISSSTKKLKITNEKNYAKN